MTTKHTHTFLSLCKAYGKIEVPIIQRDFAQGRDNQASVRNKFVDYLVDSLSQKEVIELDFIYGSVRTDIDEHDKTKEIHTFIPIDGQQRLTTLWLLHWFLAIREGNLDSIRAEMSKFLYEPRPSAHSFCERLMKEVFPADRIKDISDYIESRNWFDCDWLSDGTIKGMLQMLKSFSKKTELTEGQITLSQLTIDGDISFYFVPLCSFGLSEDIYIRMNARGKILTDFENFKSEFYKIIKNYPRIELIKDKMEYAWVNHLWPYRKHDKKNPVFVTDDCFMNYFRFISEMLYFNQAKPRNESGYASDFSDFKLLGHLYSNPENVDFLMFALDAIPKLSQLKLSCVHFWQGRENQELSFSDILSRAIRGENLVFDNKLVLYAAIAYIKKHGDCVLVKDYIRIVRNLIVNTDDKSERDRPRILSSIIKFAENKDPYLALKAADFKLEGLRESQCTEEHFKACIGLANEFAEIEDLALFKGNIKSLIAASYSPTEHKIADFSFDDSKIHSFNLEEFQTIYKSYCVVAENDFIGVWGDLIDSTMYCHIQSSGRLVYVEDYSKNAGVIALAADYAHSGIDVIEDYLIKREKDYVLKLASQNENMRTIDDVKKQLEILYIITRRILMKPISAFFHEWYNFGWLQATKGFSSIFTSGIKNDPWFGEMNPIFQTYNYQFRYNWGLNKVHAIPVEVSDEPQVGLLEDLIKWASEQ